MSSLPVDNYVLYENTPAADFQDAHLLGNGHLGASVFGGVPYEEILINHDTLWSGQEYEKFNPGTKANLDKARALVMEGKVREANELINDEMLGYWSESFMPLGYLHLTYGLQNDQRGLPQRRRLFLEYFKPEEYRRDLFLNEAVERISYKLGEDLFTREIFVSKPDGVLAIRLTAPKGKLNFALSMDSPLRHEQIVSAGKALIKGRAPDRAESYEPHYEPAVVYMSDDKSDALRFAGAAKVVYTDGETSVDRMRSYVSGASMAVILLTAETNYAGYKKTRNTDTALLASKCEEILNKAAAKGYDELKKSHIADYQSYYGRFSINLGSPITDVLPTSQRMERFKNIEDNSFHALALQYARYLLIAFSREGTQAGNLQGIWNPKMRPSWASNYTTNINVQMNYWPAETLNLSELHLPMTDLVKECADSGVNAAKELYGADGWVLHHNTDLWRYANIAGENASWAWWPFGGAWLCNHIWQHYEFTKNADYLKDVFPVLKGAAAFLLDFVVKGSDGYYYTPPSISPENKFFINDGTIQKRLTEVKSGYRFSESQAEVSAICRASTMDITLIREVLNNVKKAAAILGCENEVDSRIPEVLKNLCPFKIGRHGQLQEWDLDYEECTPGMGHVSHLYSVYPSGIINSVDEPEFFKAAYISYMRRIQHGATRGGGWPGAWAVCLGARFLDANSCAMSLSGMMSHLGANFLTKNSLQIDSIMGWAAGIAEMLIQSHEGLIHVFPALPESWRNGSVCGLRARGGYELDLEWKDHKLVHGRITAKASSGPCRLRMGDKVIDVSLTQGSPCSLEDLFK
jgi:alpha-L-fucosidase 2